jgi:cytochrome c biogenesis protein CcmG, thiol:disulfide interchange protein DsbE
VSAASRSADAAPSGVPKGKGVNAKVLLAGLVVVVPLLGILVANLGRDPHTVTSPLIGRPAPPFSLVPLGGGPPVTLESLRGRPVVLNFWASWCVPCVQEHAALGNAARMMAGDVSFYGVVYEDEEARARDFLAVRGGAYPSLLDPESKTAIAYGVFGVPETYFISPGGTIADKFVGPLTPDAIAELVAKARSLGR